MTTAALLTSAAAAEVGRLWRVAVTGRTDTPAPPPTPSPVMPPPVTVDHLHTARTSRTSQYCAPCDVTWKGTDPCWLCGTNPVTKP